MYKFIINNYRGLYHTFNMSVMAFELYILDMWDFMLDTYILPFMALYTSYRISEWILEFNGTNENMAEAQKRLKAEEQKKLNSSSNK